jgi:hypothetical protein
MNNAILSMVYMVYSEPNAKAAAFRNVTPDHFDLYIDRELYVGAFVQAIEDIPHHHAYTPAMGARFVHEANRWLQPVFRLHGVTAIISVEVGEGRLSIQLGMGPFDLEILERREPLLINTIRASFDRCLCQQADHTMDFPTQQRRAAALLIAWGVSPAMLSAGRDAVAASADDFFGNGSSGLLRAEEIAQTAFVAMLRVLAGPSEKAPPRHKNKVGSSLQSAKHGTS